MWQFVKPNPEIRIVKALSSSKQAPFMVTRVLEAPAPTMATFFATSSVDDHVADPAGTLIVSPDAAAVTQSRTSAHAGLAATRLGLEPPQAASAFIAAHNNMLSETRRPESHTWCVTGRSPLMRLTTAFWNVCHHRNQFRDGVRLALAFCARRTSGVKAPSI
jgi:hypothetical protein